MSPARSSSRPSSEAHRLGVGPWSSRRWRGVFALAVGSVLLLSACGTAGTDEDGGQDDAQNDADTGTQDGQGDEDDQNDQDRQAQLERERQELIDLRDATLAGPSQQHQDQAVEQVGELTVEQQAGQVLVGEYSGTDATDMAGLIEELHLGGAIVMGSNVPSAGEEVDVEALTSELQGLHSAAEGRDWPAIIGVDQEGGLVTRVGAPLTEWPSPMAYGAAYGGAHGEAPSDAADDEHSAGRTLAGHDLLTTLGHRGMGEQLAELGFTVDFAPNADVTVGAADPTMGTRSFGAEPEAVSDLALAGLRGLAEAGVAGSAKHFPGHGSVTEDSHVTLPDQPADVDELTERDWIPFAEVIDAGSPMIMMGHLDVPALEPGVPSSLSSAAYDQLRQMGHDGVVVTDALNMAAVVNTYGAAQAPVAALDAGADLLLMPSDVRTAHGAIVDAVDSGELDADRLQEAAERVVALMLWQQELVDGELDAGPGVALPELLAEHLEQVQEQDADATALPEHAEAGSSPEPVDPTDSARALSAQAVTLVEGICEAELIEENVTITGGTERDRALLGEALTDAGYALGGGGTQISLIAPEGWGTAGDVVVALDRPEWLEQVGAQTQIALYGRTQESFEALVQVLGGESAPGSLPVPVGEHSIGDSAC